MKIFAVLGPVMGRVKCKNFSVVFVSRLEAIKCTLYRFLICV